MAASRPAPTRRRARTLAALAVAAGVSSGLGGCGAVVAHVEAALSPGAALSQAARADGALPGLRLQLGVGLTAAQLQQAVGSAGGRLPSRAASLLAGARLDVVVHTAAGSALDAGGGGRHLDEDLSWRERGTTLVELREVGAALYARVDLAGFPAALGVPVGEVAAARSRLVRADRTVPGLAVLARGGWVSVGRAQLVALAKVLGPQLPGYGAGSDLSRVAAQRAEGQRLLHDLHAAVRASSTFRRLGAAGGASRYAMSVDLAAAWRRMAAALPAAVPGGAALAADLDRAAARLPAGRAYTVTFAVSGGRLARVEVDLGQFDPSRRLHLPLVLALAPAGPVVAPAGARPLDLTRVLPRLHAAARDLAARGAGLAHGLGAPPTTAAPAADPFG